MFTFNSKVWACIYIPYNRFYGLALKVYLYSARYIQLRIMQEIDIADLSLVASPRSEI